MSYSETDLASFIDGIDDGAAAADGGAVSDDGGTAVAVAEPAEQETTIPEPAAAESAPAESADTFPREYVEKLRRESASYRDRAKQIEAKFEGISEEDRDTFLWLVEQYKTDPAAAAKEMARLAKDLGYSEDGVQDEVPQYMTKEQFDREYEKRRQDEALQQRVAKIESDAKALGYDTETTDYMHLLIVANKQHGGDIHKAHQAIEAKAQAEFDKRLKAMQDSAANSPAVPAGGSAGTPQIEQPKSFRETGAAVMDFLNQL